MGKQKRKISVGDVNWEQVAKRLTRYRELTGLDRQQFSDATKISQSKLISCESAKERKTFGTVLEICYKCRLSVKWLLLGEGLPANKPNAEHSSFANPLRLGRGPGIRRNPLRKEAEEGRMTSQMMEFVLAVDAFKSQNKIKFPAISDIYQVMLYLGYRKTQPKMPHINCLDNGEQ